MEDIVKLGLYLALQQVIIFIPFIYIIDLLLEKQKLAVKKMVYGLLVLVGLYVVFLPLIKDVNLYMVINCIVVCCILYSGSILHKSLSIVTSLGINIVSEMLNRVFINQLLGEYIQNRKGIELIIQLGNMILILVLVIILKNKKIFKRNSCAYKGISKREITVISILALFSIVIACMGMFIFTGRIQGAYNMVFLCTIMVGAVILDLSLIIIIDHSVRVDYYKKLNGIIEGQLSKQLSYYERLEEINQQTRAIKHDMRNHMLVVSDLLKNGEVGELRRYVADITQSVMTNERLIQTGNPIADAILNEKNYSASEQQIRMNINMQLSKNMNVNSVDLCTILSNSIDNAIEACGKLGVEEDREIRVIGRINHGYLVIQIINKTQEEIVIRNNTIKTSKKEEKQHGYGLENIKKSVAKYKGEFNLSLKEQYFMLEVIINTSYV